MATGAGTVIAVLVAGGVLVIARQAVSPELVRKMEAFVDCPREGRTRTGKVLVGEIARLSMLKNRVDAPTRFDSSVTLKAMLEPGRDRHRWDSRTGDGVRITGYVAWIIPNFLGESCNCYRTDDAHTDDHLDLVLFPADTSYFPKHVIVEITPRMKYLAKQRGTDWSTPALQKKFLGKKVTVEGWLLYDKGHEDIAKNTHPVDPKHRNWRATCWEVHPVTNIKLAS